MMMMTKTLLLLILFAITPATLVNARLGEAAQSARRQQEEAETETLEANDIFANKDMQNELMVATNCTGTPWPCAEFGRGGIEYCYTAAGVPTWTGCHWRWNMSNNDFMDGDCYGEPIPCSEYHSDRLGCLMMGCTPRDD
jgi:hypothetical protein